MEIISARKNEPREGNTRGEKELCTSTEMIPTTKTIPAVTTEMIPGILGIACLSRAPCSFLRRYFQAPATQANGCRKLELVFLRAWQTEAVKEKSVKLQLKYGSLSRF